MTATSLSLQSLGMLAVSGCLWALPAASLAGPGAAPDCLKAVATPSSSAGSPAQATSVGHWQGGARAVVSQPVLLSQALTPRRAGGSETWISQTTNQEPAAGAAPAEENLPACTYDPPLPQVIRGLW